MNAVAEWVARIRPIAESTTTIFEELDGTDIAFDAYLDGMMDEAEFRGIVENSRREIDDIAESLLEQYNALPPPPDVSLGRGKLGVSDSTSQLPEMIAKLRFAC
jgi:hypothetical protein